MDPSTHKQTLFVPKQHGASADTAMTHIVIQEKLDGKAVEWMEHVTDEEYRQGSTAS
jgi:hypothetical protein